MLDTLKQDLMESHPLVVFSESAIRERIYAADNTFAPMNRGLFELYFRYYTIPLLDALGVLANDESFDDACYWGAIQVSLGLHIRYLDYLVDREGGDAETPAFAGKAAESLFFAQQLLASRGHSWSMEQWVLYRQCFEFEKEVVAGYVHGPLSLWRRVSPLSVLGMTHCAGMVTQQFASLYNRYLGWCLLSGDHKDWLKDLSANRKTNVTALLVQPGVEYPTEGHITAVLAHVRAALDFGRVELDGLLSADRYPAWRVVWECVSARERELL